MSLENAIHSLVALTGEQRLGGFRQQGPQRLRGCRVWPRTRQQPRLQQRVSGQQISLSVVAKRVLDRAFAIGACQQRRSSQAAAGAWTPLYLTRGCEVNQARLAPRVPGVEHRCLAAVPEQKSNRFRCGIRATDRPISAASQRTTRRLSDVIADCTSTGRTHRAVSYTSVGGRVCSDVSTDALAVPPLDSARLGQYGKTSGRCFLPLATTRSRAGRARRSRRSDARRHRPHSHRRRARSQQAVLDGMIGAKSAPAIGPSRSRYKPSNKEALRCHRKQS